jgi:hypothetical protein
MTTFLRLALAGRDSDVTLINVDHIVRILPLYSFGREPQGSTVVLSDDTSVHVRASLDELQQRLTMTSGRCSVLSEPHKYANEHEVDEAYEAARADLIQSAI